jgi:hypothetical protein
MKIRNSIKLPVFAAILLLCAIGAHWAWSSEKPVPKADLCDVLGTPSKYSAKTITVVARITSTKEGGFLWSPSCPRRGVRLIIDQKSGSGSGTTELSAALRKHGLSDNPVIATLTGVYVADYFDDVRNRHYPVFRITAASHVRQSRRVERP